MHTVTTIGLGIAAVSVLAFTLSGSGIEPLSVVRRVREAAVLPVALKAYTGWSLELARHTADPASS